MNKTLTNQALSGKAKQPHCPFCSISITICYGFYHRNHPKSGEQIKIQRYLCKAPACPVTTFSILPYPLLRIVRHTYQRLKQVYILRESGMNQASVSRITGLKRGVIKRLYAFSGRFFPWLDSEHPIAQWGAGFESEPCSVWPAFIRDFSHTFYPGKFGIVSPT